MKRGWLLVGLTIALVAFTSGTVFAASENAGGWIAGQTVNEFGDVTEDSEAIIQTTMSGTFSNSATAESDLLVTLSVFENKTMSFSLLEYNSNPINFYSSDEITLSTKIYGDTHDYTLTGDPNKFTLYLEGLGAYVIYDSLERGADVECIITIGSSRYNFTILSENFAELSATAWDDAITSTKSFITASLKCDQKEDCYNFINSHINAYKTLNAQEITDIIQGEWLQITIDTSSYDEWWVFGFNETERYQIGRYLDDNHNRKGFEGTYEKTDAFSHKYTIENDCLNIYSFGDKYTSFIVKKLQDGYYFLINADDVSEEYLYCSYNDQELAPLEAQPELPSIADSFNQSEGYSPLTDVVSITPMATFMDGQDFGDHLKYGYGYDSLDNVKTAFDDYCTYLRTYQYEEEPFELDGGYIGITFWKDKENSKPAVAIFYMDAPYDVFTTPDNTEDDCYMLVLQVYK